MYCQWHAFIGLSFQAFEGNEMIHGQ